MISIGHSCGLFPIGLKGQMRKAGSVFLATLCDLCVPAVIKATRTADPVMKQIRRSALQRSGGYLIAVEKPIKQRQSFTSP